MVEFGIEVNADYFPWSGIWNGGGVTDQYGDPNKADGPERFQDAYRHIIDLFRDQEVKNITWAFYPGAVSFPDEKWNTIEAYYPGDDYIDRIGLSNYGAQENNEEWDSFKNILDKTYIKLVNITPDKPLAIFEFGVTENHSDGNKAQWIKEALQIIADNNYPRLKAISYWHESWTNEDGTISSLRVDSSEESKQAYQEGIKDDIFVTEINISNWYTSKNIKLSTIFLA
jgi:beta-mannanase